LRWIPLGGLGEIGLNCMVFECGGRILVVDAGAMFPETHMLGVDLVIPDIGYLRERASQILGIVLTHGHEDHIGALPYILPQLPGVPLYGTPFTLSLVWEKLVEHGLETGADLHEVDAGQALSLGPFELEFIRVCHSISDGVGLAIKTPVGVIVHSGDFKFDPTPVGEEPLNLQAFSRYGEQGVRLLLSDSTNVERPGYSVSEHQIQRNLEEVFRGSEGRIIFSSFSSNIQRIREVITLTQRFDRKLYINGRSMITAVRLAGELGYLKIPAGLMVDSKALPEIRKEQLVVLTTGSQGEPLSALSLMARERHKWLKVDAGDTVIFSSRFIPGNEKAIYSIINAFYRRGARVVYEPLAHVHVSGHASREELKLMVQLTRPQYFVPIHGEYRHLIQHVELAKEAGVAPHRSLMAENGDIFVLTPEGFAKAGCEETGRVYVDGKGVGDVGDTVLRDRRHLSGDGLVVALLVLNKAGGEIISGPDLFTRGFIFEEDSNGMMAEAKQVLVDAVTTVRKCPEGDQPDDLEAKIRGALRSYFWRRIRRRPMIMPLIVEL
jgi:ribonuclease J